MGIMLRVVCAVIRDSEGRFLVCQRPEGKALAGKWEFPGGKVEPGEDPGLALQREIMEELACEIELGTPLPEVEHHYPQYSIRLLPFLCDLRSGVPAALEHSGLLWVSSKQCHTLDWAPADVPVWQALAE
jgi:8-oxo-dGTP diphosphatase